MNRFEKNVAGEDVRVDTPDFGCIVIDAALPDPTKKAKPAKSVAEAADEGEI